MTAAAGTRCSSGASARCRRRHRRRRRAGPRRGVRRGQLPGVDGLGVELRGGSGDHVGAHGPSHARRHARGTPVDRDRNPPRAPTLDPGVLPDLLLMGVRDRRRGDPGLPGPAHGHRGRRQPHDPVLSVSSRESLSRGSMTCQLQAPVDPSIGNLTGRVLWDSGAIAAATMASSLGSASNAPTRTSGGPQHAGPPIAVSVPLAVRR